MGRRKGGVDTGKLDQRIQLGVRIVEVFIDRLLDVSDFQLHYINGPIELRKLMGADMVQLSIASGDGSLDPRYLCIDGIMQGESEAEAAGGGWRRGLCWWLLRLLLRSL